MDPFTVAAGVVVWPVVAIARSVYKDHKEKKQQESK